MTPDQIIDRMLDADLKRQRRLWVAQRIRYLSIDVLSPKCGNCQHWMKSSRCPRESNDNGRQRGPSVSGIPCSKFIENGWELQWARDELAALEIERAEGGR
jgi:hypothetical protein